MNTLSIARLSTRALLRNKLRSFLTMLGVVIGVGAVIAMVAIGEGAKRRVEETFESMGTNLLIVMPGSASSGGMRGGFGSQATLTWGDLAAVRTELKAVRTAAPVMRAGVVVQSEEQTWTTGLIGTSTEYFTIRNWRASSGRMFSEDEVESSAKVVVLGRTVVTNLFGAADPVGQTVRIRAIPFLVVGVLEGKGQSPMGSDYDDTLVTPYTTYSSKIAAGLGKFIAGSMFVSAMSERDTGRAQAELESLLRDRHRLAPGSDDDFSVRNLAEVARAQEQGTQILTTLLAAIATVSLLVGGIGIMNIMLVSVTERTREIGVRIAVGARSWDVLAQFLGEALALSLAGGAVGILFGLFAAAQLARLYHWPFLVHADVIVMSVGFSAAVGVVFGLYPARKASRLDPIEALRFE
ncbi:MAG: ABC transporter permease [Deltaproteobacteria bacterium]|nr:ABC transporter permease [Deltaproteobacteria bacterium]